MFNIDEKYRKTIYEMFNRTEESAEEDVKTIKKWLKTQYHLPEIMEEAKIRNFLIMNKYSIERTKQKIDMYYTIRSVIPDLFVDINPKLPHMKNIMETTYCCIHPKAVEGLYRVVILKLKEPNKFAVRELGAQCFNIYEMKMSEDCTVSDIVIFDMANMTLNDMMKCTPTMVTKIYTIYKKVYSLRVRTTYVINSPSYIDMLMSIVKTIAEPKIYNRIQVHHNAEVVKEIFSKEDLPKDYGGDGPSLQELNNMMERKFEEYRCRFDELDTMRVDENMRPETLNNDDVLGFHGNFKKLNVD